MADLYLTPAEKYTAALGGFYYGDLPEPGTVYTQLIKDILNGTTPDKEPKNILARFIYSLYISDLDDPYPRYELAKLLYWKLHDITPTKSGSILTVTIDGKEDYMTINTDLSRLWYKVLFGSKTDVITDFPYIFNTMQNKLSDWELFGNVEVSGTPTPDNPVMPEGCGERTGNLAPPLTEWVDGYVNSGTGTIHTPTETREKSSDFIRVEPNSVYVFSHENGDFPSGDSGAWRVVGLYDSNKQFISRVGSANPLYLTITATAETAYIRLSFRTYGGSGNVMLNTDSTALPYEPYGIKIPISSAGQTTTVYPGEVETTRQIKKLVLDGTENWYISAVWKKTNTSVFYFTVNNIYGKSDNESYILSTHLPSKSRNELYSNDVEGIGKTGSNAVTIRISDTIATTVPELKTWLSQNNVSIWYVLATPTTGIVNEPLMKIGDYTDSMSRAKTGIDIPTVIGQNTLDVLTTVKPSSMRIEYTSADETRSRSKRISLLKSPLKKGLIK